MQRPVPSKTRKTSLLAFTFVCPHVELVFVQLGEHLPANLTAAGLVTCVCPSHVTVVGCVGRESFSTMLALKKKIEK